MHYCIYLSSQLLGTFFSGSVTLNSSDRTATHRRADGPSSFKLEEVGRTRPTRVLRELTRLRRSPFHSSLRRLEPQTSWRSSVSQALCSPNSQPLPNMWCQRYYLIRLRQILGTECPVSVDLGLFPAIKSLFTTHLPEPVLTGQCGNFLKLQLSSIK